MNVSQTNANPNTLSMHELMRLVFIIFLVITPFLPYVIAGIYNHHLSTMLQVQAEALPVYPGARLKAKDLRFRPANVEPCHLQLRIQYQTNAPFEEVEKYYESTLQQLGWHKTDHDYYTKAPMHIRVDHGFKTSNPKSSGFNKKGYRIKIFITTDVWQPIFQLRCEL